MISDNWHPISENPSRPLQAEIFFGNLFLMDGEVKVSAIIAPHRDERRQIAYWDGEVWRYMGTGHALNEWGDDGEEWLPTHWRELPPLPEGSNDKAA